MKKTARYWEIDVARALALFLMLVQHVFVIKNLVFLNITQVSQQIIYIGRSGALLFLLLVGISGYISYCSSNQKNPILHFFRRGLFLLACGVLVSIISFFAVPRAPVYFGVLSFIGLVVMLLPFFINYPKARLITILLAPVIGYIFTVIHPSSLLLLPFGLYPVPFYSVDYWPLFPWISVVLCGVIIGESLYANGKRQFALTTSHNPIIGLLQWVGSHTLLLYLLHFPLLYSIFWVFKLFIQ